MARNPHDRSQFHQRGYATSADSDVGWCDPNRDEPSDMTAMQVPRGALLELFGPDDGHVAVAAGQRLQVFTFEDFCRRGAKAKPRAELKLNAPLRLLAADHRGTAILFGADEKNSVVTVDLTPGPGETDPIADEPQQSRLELDGDAPIRALTVQPDGLIVQTKLGGRPYRMIHRIDRRSHVVTLLGHVRTETDLHPLSPRAHNLFIARRKGEVQVVMLPEDEAGQIEAHPLGIERVTAATILDGTYLVVARKGGQIEKARLASALPAQTATTDDPLARACKILCQLLRRCDCHDCRCDSGRPVDPEDGGGPGRGPVDDEPCGDRHRAMLSWTAARLYRVGAQTVAFAAGNRRMAVLDANLNLLFEQKIDQRNAIVAAGLAQTQRMLVLRPAKAEVQAWELADYIATLPGFRPDSFIPVPLPEPTKVTYFGQKNPPAAANPTVRICVFTVMEPGQSFGDPNQTKLVNQITPNIFDVVDDYYRECSFGETNIAFDVFGHDIGGTGTPLVLPRAIASYFWDDFAPGGLEAVMPADFSDPVALDGTEALTMRANPRSGASRDYDVPFAGLWTSTNQGAFPVDINFDGTETAELTVETQTGATHVLSIGFPAQNFTHNQGEDDTAFLASLGTYVTNAIRSAESALPGAPLTIQDVEFRRIRLNDDNAQFGRLQGRFRVASADGGATQKGRITVTGPAGPTPPAVSDIGLTSNAEHGVISSTIAASDYFRECLRAAQVDANEGPGAQDPYFSTNVLTDYDNVAQELTVTFRLTSERGGEGADIERLSTSGLAGTGWDVASPAPGSESNANNQNALRDYREMADDTFTAALDRIRSQGPWDPAAVEALFANYDVMMIGFVGAPPSSVPVGDAWNAASPVDFGRLRMFARTHFATDLNNPNPADDPVQMGTSRIIGQKFSSFSSGVMAHEIGHALGLPDLYSAQGYRDDVDYVDPYAMMAGGNSNFHHFIGWAKWKLGWIEEDANPELNRVIDVLMPAAGGPTTTEAWLVPVEYWDDMMHDDVRTEVGGTIEIGQLMKLHLGSDGGVLAFLELRAEGAMFSKNLSNEPTVIATNGLDPETDRRWAVNGLYRRAVHLLNTGTELRNTGDTWDFATAPEFPVKGCVAEVIDTRTIRGAIPIYRVAVTREQAEFIDLYFEDNVPSYKSPDIWVDWRGDNPDPDIPRMYPVGTPTDQGETVRFPASGFEPHFVVARVHNAGNVRAEDVKVRWFVCDPPGSGDDGRWVERGTQTIAQVDAGTNEIVPFDWEVDSSTNVHQCLRMEIIDWTIPTEVDPATGDTVALASDDVKLQNNNAQQNVFDFEALTGSPYTPITFEMQVHNDYREPERASLVPSNLPYGATLEISPAEAIIPPNQAQIFSCTLTLKEEVIRPGCDNDQGFLLSAWRRGVEADELWGSCFYWVRPRYRTATELLRGTWLNGRVSIYGRVHVLSDQATIATDAPHQVRVRLYFESNGRSRTEWHTLPLAADGSFHLVSDPAKGEVLEAQAWFDRTDSLGSSVSDTMVLKHSKLI